MTRSIAALRALVPLGMGSVFVCQKICSSVIFGIIIFNNLNLKINFSTKILTSDEGAVPVALFQGKIKFTLIL